MFGQPEVVGLRAAAEAEGSEVEPDGVFGSGFAGERVAVDFDVFRLPVLALGDAGEQGGEFLFVFGMVGNEEDGGVFQIALAVVVAAVYVEDGEFLLDEFDGGQKAAAVLSFGIEFGRGVVGGGNENDAFCKQVFEQAAEYHGVGDVADVEFVETQDAGFFGDVFGDGGKGVGFAFFAAHALVDFGHEGVEVDSAFAAVGQTAVEGVHEKAFAAADAAVEIDAARNFGGTQAAAEKAVALAFEHHEFVPEFVQMVDGAGLGGVADEAVLLGGGLIPA